MANEPIVSLSEKDKGIKALGDKIVGSWKNLELSVKQNLMLPAPAAVPAVLKQDAEIEATNPILSALDDIKQAVLSLVDRFTDILGIEQNQLDILEKPPEEDVDAAVADAQSTELLKEKVDDTGPGVMRRTWDSLKDKARGMKDNLMGLLKKGAVMGLLAGAFILINKYADEISAALTPVVDGLKRFWTSIKEDIGPLWDTLIDTVKSAFESLSNIIVGLFTLDTGKFMTGIKQLFTEFIPNVISYIGQGITMVVKAIGELFGFDMSFCQDILQFFRDFPENVKKMIENAINFITDTIPTKFNEMKTAVSEWIGQKIDFIKDEFMNAFTFITEDVPAKIGEMKDRIIGGVINMVDKIFSPVRNLMQRMIISTKEFLNSVIDKANVLLPKKWEIPKFDIPPMMSETEIADKAAGITTGDATGAEVEHKKTKTAEGFDGFSKSLDANLKNIEEFMKQTGTHLNMKTSADWFSQGMPNYWFEDHKNGGGYLIAPKNLSTIKDTMESIKAIQGGMGGYLDYSSESFKNGASNIVDPALPPGLQGTNKIDGAGLNAESSKYSGAGSANPKINIISKNQGDTISATKNVSINEEKPVGADTSHLSNTFFKKRK